MTLFHYNTRLIYEQAKVYIRVGLYTGGFIYGWVYIRVGLYMDGLIFEMVRVLVNWWAYIYMGGVGWCLIFVGAYIRRFTVYVYMYSILYT